MKAPRPDRLLSVTGGPQGQPSLDVAIDIEQVVGQRATERFTLDVRVEDLPVVVSIVEAEPTFGLLRIRTGIDIARLRVCRQRDRCAVEIE